VFFAIWHEEDAISGYGHVRVNLHAGCCADNRDCFSQFNSRALQQAVFANVSEMCMQCAQRLQLGTNALRQFIASWRTCEHY